MVFMCVAFYFHSTPNPCSVYDDGGALHTFVNEFYSNAKIIFKYTMGHNYKI